MLLLLYRLLLVLSVSSLKSSHFVRFYLKVQVNRICSFILSFPFLFYILHVTLHRILSCATRWYICICFLVTSIVYYILRCFFHLTLHKQDLAVSEEIAFTLIDALRSE